ncbi:MAG: 4-oxalocrotonate tautomerase family protein [Cycloclasticus sp.]|nr:4-oxalocrotonate tautomerase family protein [Cycloclasticus sp.]
MPIAHIHMMEGRTEEQKAAVIEKVTDALCEAVDAPRQNVRVLIQEVPNTQFGIGGVTAKSLGR